MSIEQRPHEDASAPQPQEFDRLFGAIGQGEGTLVANFDYIDREHFLQGKEGDYGIRGRYVGDLDQNQDLIKTLHSNPRLRDAFLRAVPKLDTQAQLQDLRSEVGTPSLHGYEQVAYSDAGIQNGLAEIEKSDGNLKKTNDIIEQRLGLEKNLYKFVDTPHLMTIISDLRFTNGTYIGGVLSQLGYQVPQNYHNMDAWSVIRAVRAQIPAGKVDDLWKGICERYGYTFGRFANKHANFFSGLRHDIHELAYNPEQNGVVRVCEAVCNDTQGDALWNATFLGEAARLSESPAQLEKVNVVIAELQSNRKVGSILSDLYGDASGISGDHSDRFSEGQLRNIFAADKIDENVLCNAVADWIEQGGYSSNRTEYPGEINALRSGNYSDLRTAFLNNPLLSLYLRRGIQEDPGHESLSMKTVNRPVAPKARPVANAERLQIDSELREKFDEVYDSQLDAAYEQKKSECAGDPDKLARLDDLYDKSKSADRDEVFRGFSHKMGGVLIDLQNEGIGAGVSVGIDSDNYLLQHLNFDFSFVLSEATDFVGFGVRFSDGIDVGENGRLHADLGVINFAIPYFVLGYTHHIPNSDTLHHFAQGVEGEMYIDLTGGISTIGNFVALSVGKDRVQELDSGRDALTRGLLQSLSGISRSSDITSQRVYEALQGQDIDFATADRIAMSLRNTFENEGFDQGSEAFRENLARASVDAIAQGLYVLAAQRSDGWHLSGFRIGLLNLAIPIVGFRLTDLDVTWAEDPGMAQRARFERATMAGATNIDDFQGMRGASTKEKVERYFADSESDRPSPVSYSESNGMTQISSTRGILTDGAERAYSDVSYQDGVISFPSDKYDIHLSRSLHTQGEEPPHIILIPRNSLASTQRHTEYVDVERSNYKTIGNEIDAKFNDLNAQTAIFRRIESLDSTGFDRPAEMYLRILGMDATDPGLTNSAFEAVLGRLTTRKGDGLVDFVKANPTDAPDFIRSVFQRGALEGRPELTYEEGVALKQYMEDMRHEMHPVDTFAGEEDILGGSLVHLETTHTNIRTLYTDRSDVAGAGSPKEGISVDEQQFSADMCAKWWTDGLTSNTDTFVLCGHSFDLQNYFNGLETAIRMMKSNGTYDGVRNKKMTFFLRGCSATSARADLLKYFPNAQFICSSAVGNGVNQTIYKNMLSGQQPRTGITHPDYSFPSVQSQEVFRQYASSQKPDGSIRIHGGKKKKGERTVTPAVITVATYDAGDRPQIETKEFNILMTAPKKEEPEAVKQPEKKPEKEPDEKPKPKPAPKPKPETPETPVPPEGPENPNPPEPPPQEPNPPTPPEPAPAPTPPQTPTQTSTPAGTTPTTDVPQTGGTDIPAAGNTNPTSTTSTIPSGTSTGSTGSVSPGTSTNPDGL